MFHSLKLLSDEPRILKLSSVRDASSSSTERQKVIKPIICKSYIRSIKARNNIVKLRRVYVFSQERYKKKEIRSEEDLKDEMAVLHSRFERLSRCCTYSGRGNQLILLAGYKYSVQSSKHSEYIQSKRGKRLLLYLGYSYYATSGGPRIRWRCSTNSYMGCRATVHTHNDCIVYTKGYHSHPPRNIAACKDV
ncbi:hypothetical protein RR46_03793 [Papilio xuthus]|uniref:FLYWCH-type domain-containing protein n=1 Tax=Papilio xuthus TaxID=66420 RepID=A0A194Q265_PAPXU|nr:hypothetical protein RR46_03793 [Papilio xuthus]